MPKLEQPETYGELLSVLNVALNGSFGKRRVQLATANDTRFARVREAEMSLFASICQRRPEERLTADDDRTVAEFLGLITDSNGKSTDVPERPSFGARLKSVVGL